MKMGHWGLLALVSCAAAVLGPGAADATSAPRVTAVIAGYSGAAITGNARFCDSAVREKTRYRIGWRVYGPKGRVIRRASYVISSSRTCVGTRRIFEPVLGYGHTMGITVTNLASGRSDTARSGPAQES